MPRDPEIVYQGRQSTLRYRWTRDGLARAREAFDRGACGDALTALLHALLMRESARDWRRREAILQNEYDRFHEAKKRGKRTPPR